MTALDYGHFFAPVNRVGLHYSHFFRIRQKRPLIFNHLRREKSFSPPESAKSG
jgi:hypothetical protein